jgi:hypothetical protein
MTTLLESRTHHHRLRVLSRKAQESLTHDEEPSKRRSPAVPPDSRSTNDDVGESLITRRQRSQRLRRQKEKSLRLARELTVDDDEISNRSFPILPPVSYANDDDPMSQRTQTQRRQREAERVIQGELLKKVSQVFLACS